MSIDARLARLERETTGAQDVCDFWPDQWVTAEKTLDADAFLRAQGHEAPRDLVVILPELGRSPTAPVVLVSPPPMGLK